MSTIPKEIMDKINEAGMKMFPDWANAQSGHSDLYERFVQAAEYGYQLATDGREELEKENWMKENPPFAAPYPKEKRFYIDEVGELLRKYKAGELSISKITELLNEKIK
jgi:hypothetical protein